LVVLPRKRQCRVEAWTDSCCLYPLVKLINPRVKLEDFDVTLNHKSWMLSQITSILCWLVTFGPFLHWSLFPLNVEVMCLKKVVQRPVNTLLSIL
jgi:hypothetical protein